MNPNEELKKLKIQEYFIRKKKTEYIAELRTVQKAYERLKNEGHADVDLCDKEISEIEEFIKYVEKEFEKEI